MNSCSQEPVGRIQGDLEIEDLLGPRAHVTEIVDTVRPDAELVDHAGNVPRDVAESPLAGHQLLLSPAALGDVGDHLEDADDLPLIVLKGARRDNRPERAAIVATKLEVVGLADPMPAALQVDMVHRS